MFLAFSTDQQALFDAFDHFFVQESPSAVVRAAEQLGFDSGLWRKLETFGVWGAAASMTDLSVIAETVGRSIAPVPFAEHAAASRFLGLIAGDPLATISLRAADNGLWRLVPAGAVADIVVGISGESVVSSASSPPLSGPRNHAASPLADRRVDNADAVAPADAFVRVLAEWKTLTAATLVGLATRSLEIAVAYVKERHQFGVPVGSFQAVQHALADFPGLIDGARLLVYEAAAALDRDEPGQCDVGFNDIDDATTLASMAFLFASDVATRVTDRALHVHGGYGFAEEYDIQLYYRRARGWSLILGDPADECHRLADRLWPQEISTLLVSR